MAVLDNTTKQEDTVVALDVEFSANFNADLDRLTEILGLFDPEIIAAGTALYQYKVTGTLSAESVEEGDETPLTKYVLTKESIGEIEFKPYRKLTTAQAILKGGVENAVRRTDDKMVKDIRAAILDKFFTFLKTGTGEADQAETLQMALAQTNAKLSDTLEKNNDSADTVVYFVNPYDIATYLGDASITTQTVFGMTYLQSFLGVQNIFVTNRVEKGTIWATPTENIHMYGVDFAALADAGIVYNVQDGSLLGVHHDVNYVRNSAETFAATGCTLLAEIKDYIVKGTISPLE